MVKNLPSNAGHVGSILVEELSLHIAIKMQRSQNLKKKKSGREEQPHLQGAAAAREGREELLHVQGQERRP